MLLLFPSFSISMEQPLKKSKVVKESEQINACSAPLPKGFVPVAVVNKAIFNKNSTFVPGEIVIVKDVTSPLYLYACVTQIAPSSFRSKGNDIYLKHPRSTRIQPFLEIDIGKISQPDLTLGEQRVQTCLAHLSEKPVPPFLVNEARFSNENVFEIGDLIIVYDSSKSEHFYACVTNVYPGNEESIVAKTKLSTRPNFYSRNAVGKIRLPDVPSLLDISIENMRNLVQSGKLKLEDIRVLPAEIYEKIIPAQKQ